MKSHYTAKELAGLTGLPGTERSVQRKADREQWPFRAKAGRGGGREYAIASLPEATKDHLHRLAMEAAGQALVPAVSKKIIRPAVSKEVALQEIVSPQAITELKDWQREIYLARLSLYNEFKQLQTLHGTCKAVEKLVIMARTSTLPAHLQPMVAQANARRGEDRHLSKSMILGWDRRVKKHGEMGLAPRPVRERRIATWAPLFISCYGQPQNPSLTEAMEAMAKILPEGMVMPTYHQVYRFHTKRSRLDRERGRKTGSEFRALQGYRKRDTSELLPFQVGVCDGHSFKAKVAHPITGNPFKPEICSVIDAATKMIMGWSVGLAESALTVAGAVRHAATINENKQYGGVFAIFYTDNGAGNMAGVNDDELTGIFARIGSTHRTGIPGNAQGRGLIERLNSSLWIRSAKELPTYMGKQMDSLTSRNMYLLVNRQIKQNGVSHHLPSWPQFMEHCQQSVEAYNRRPHSSLPKFNDPETGARRHMAPLELLAWHMMNGWNPEECRLAQTDLDLLFLPRETRVVRRASVGIFSNTYCHKILEHYEGETVQVGYDIHDGEKVQIWNADGQMLCYAIFEKNRTSYFPQAQVEEASRKRAQRRRQINLDKISEIDAEERGLIEAAPVVKMIDYQASSPKIRADRAQLQAEMAAAPLVEIPADDKGKYGFWKALDVKVNQGETLEGKELRFYNSFCNGITYKAFRATEEQFSEVGK